MGQQLVSSGSLQVVRRIGVFLSIFAGTTSVMLILSWFLFLPAMMQLPLEGRSIPSGNFHQYIQDLQGRIRVAANRRDELINPVRDPLYAQLRTEKYSYLLLPSLYSEIQQVAGIVAEGRNDVVLLRSVQFRRGERTLLLEGEVRNVGPRSMTILAQFVDHLRTLSSITSIDPLTFRREHDVTKGFTSPFNLILRLSLPSFEESDTPDSLMSV